MIFKADWRVFIVDTRILHVCQTMVRGVRRHQVPRRERRVYRLRELDKMCHHQAVKPSRRRAT